MNLNQITLASVNMGLSIAFYKSLGLVVIVDALPGYVRFECPDGETTLSIHKAEGLQPGRPITLYFEVDDIEGTVSKLKRKGITFSSGIVDQPWLWKEAHLNDPDGHPIIIFHAGHNRKYPPWRVPSTTK